MASIAAIRNAMQSALEAIEGWHPYDTAIGGERVPALIVFPAPGGGKATAGGTYKRMFVVEAHAPLGSLARAQDMLDDLIDDGSTSNVEDVLESDHTLGGVVDYCAVGEFDAYGFSELNGQDTLMVRIPVEVMHT